MRDEWASEEEKREQWERETRGKMMPMAQPAIPHPSPDPISGADYRNLADDEKARVWRVDQMFEAGLRDPQVARRLSGSSYDLHKICDAIRAGCPPHLLLRIFT